MKKKNRIFAALALCTLPLSIIACSGNDEATKPGREGSVTVTGVNTSRLTSMSLGLSSVAVTVDGKATTVSGITGVLDLVHGGAQSVAKFVVPPDARDVRVVVRFDDYGAYQTTDGASGIVDARGKVLTLALPASGNAAVSIDLERSLAGGSGGQVLEPHYAALY